MTILLQDLRYALRMLIKSPAFTAIAVLTLALGIGANTTLFSVVNGVLLNPLPYRSPDRLVAIYEKNAGLDRAPISYPNFLDWERGSKTIPSMAIYRHEDYNLTGTAKPERLNGLMVSAAFFPTLGVQPVLGRTFTRDDDRVGAGPVVVLSGGFWKRRFAASPAVIGQTINLRGVAYQVIGVLPPGFAFYGVDRDIYIPIGQWNDPSFLDRRVDMSAHAVGRLSPGVTLAQARTDMDAIARPWLPTTPKPTRTSASSALQHEGRPRRRRPAIAACPAGRRRLCSSHRLRQCRQSFACSRHPQVRGVCSAHSSRRWPHPRNPPALD